MGMAQWRALACLACGSLQVSFPGLKGGKKAAENGMCVQRF